MVHWTLDDIPWHRFDAAAVDAEIVDVVKAAAMVEMNGADYATYLCNVFSGDPAFCAAARRWAAEEVQHGEALGRWAELADPGFDFAAAFGRFTEGYRLSLGATHSVRGSRAGELVARCVVEVGTSSYYSALRDATREPVLSEICHRIAGDEFRHYKLFLEHLRRYQRSERLGLLRRLRVAIGRVVESGDDELAFAFHCGTGTGAAYDRKRSIREYRRRAYPLYRFGHVARALRMVLRAVGMNPQGRLARVLARAGWRLLQFRTRRLRPAAV